MVSRKNVEDDEGKNRFRLLQKSGIGIEDEDGGMSGTWLWFQQMEQLGHNVAGSVIGGERACQVDSDIFPAEHAHIGFLNR